MLKEKYIWIWEEDSALETRTFPTLEKAKKGIVEALENDDGVCFANGQDILVKGDILNVNVKETDYEIRIMK